MDQEKIGKFIAVCRKERGLTQAQLAEKLGVTDRAVSKWENAKSMPDSSMMLPLCEILGINVNELLTGEKIAMKDYDRYAEENLIRLKKENEEQAKRLLTMEWVIGGLASAAYIILIFISQFIENHIAPHGIPLRRPNRFRRLASIAHRSRFFIENA